MTKVIRKKLVTEVEQMEVSRICMTLGSKYWAFAFSFNFPLSPKVVSFIFCQQTLIISHLCRSYPGDFPKNGEKVTNLYEKPRPSNNGLLRSASADFRSPKSLFKSSSGDIRGSIQKSSSGDFRSSSAEPEFLRFWLEKDRAINKVDVRSKKQQQSASPSDKGKHYQMALSLYTFSFPILKQQCVLIMHNPSKRH